MSEYSCRDLKGSKNATSHRVLCLQRPWAISSRRGLPKRERKKKKRAPFGRALRRVEPAHADHHSWEFMMFHSGFTDSAVSSE